MSEFKYWLIKASSEDRYAEMRSQDAIAIDFDFLPDLNNLKKRDIQQGLTENDAALSQGDAILQANQILRFINKIEIGDKVFLVYNESVSVAEVTSGYTYSGQASGVLSPHQRQAKWLVNDQPLEHAPEGVRESMKEELAVGPVDKDYFHSLDSWLRDNFGLDIAQRPEEVAEKPWNLY